MIKKKAKTTAQETKKMENAEIEKAESTKPKEIKKIESEKPKETEQIKNVSFVVEKKSEKKKTKNLEETKKSWFNKIIPTKNKQKEISKEPDQLENKDLQQVLHVREEKKISGLTSFITRINYIGIGKERNGFIHSLSLMLNAGLSLVEALNALHAEARTKSMKKIIAKILVAVESGVPLWRAMSNTCFFTPYEIALIHIGEDAGNLAKNMVYLAEQQEKDHALRQKVKMAMIYPTIVLVMVFIIVMGLGMFVLPSLIQVLFSLNVELPLTTRIIIQVTHFFENHGIKFITACISVFIAVTLFSKYTSFRIITQWISFRLPGIGRLAREATIAHFGVILGGMLRAGVPLVEAMESLIDVTQIVSYKNYYRKLLKHISLGDSFGKSFSLIPNTNKRLPVSVQQLVMTGERSGTLSTTLLKIADIYEKKAQETAEKLPIILEPILLLFIGALVGTIAFSVITPIYGVVGNVGR